MHTEGAGPTAWHICHLGSQGGEAPPCSGKNGEEVGGAAEVGPTTTPRGFHRGIQAPMCTLPGQGPVPILYSLEVGHWGNTPGFRPSYCLPATRVQQDLGGPMAWGWKGRGPSSHTISQGRSLVDNMNNWKPIKSIHFKIALNEEAHK